MKKFLFALALVGGCTSENDLLDSRPLNGVPNARPVPVTAQEDKLVQVQVPEVDILWIIDNSGSMANEQAALSLNFPIFMDFFLGSGLDYHIGSVSTDMNKASESGKLQSSGPYRFIDEATPNPEVVFQGMAVLGTGGSSNEQGRDAAYSAIAINPGNYNDGFYREDASLHMVAISDEEDHSNAIPLGEFINWLDTLKWSEDMVTFSSIVSPRPVCAGAAEPGDNYNAITQAIGGITAPICDEDGWGDVLEQLGIQASGLKREYFLSDLPVPGTIEVEVIEAGVIYTFEEEVDWIYNDIRNSIVFIEFVPTALSEVYVTYDLLAAQDNAL
ncbi:MAG: hypothetical protein GWP91_22000 [Rhodobacterales bacterium]|nr:hypothetical protein [Rhodobacterales bacterium]